MARAGFPSPVPPIAAAGLAVGVARALAIAKHAAVERGTDLQPSLVTITEEEPPPIRSSWRR